MSEVVSGQFDVPKSMVSDIWRERQKIEAYVTASDCPSVIKKR